MIKPTPGPWRVVDAGGVLTIQPAGAQVWTNHGGAMANALLMAAAPDLKQALELLLQSRAVRTQHFCEVCREHAHRDKAGMVVGPVLHEPNCPVSMAEDALAKAMGER